MRFMEPVRQAGGAGEGQGRASGGRMQGTGFRWRRRGEVFPESRGVSRFNGRRWENNTGSSSGKFGLSNLGARLYVSLAFSRCSCAFAGHH